MKYNNLIITFENIEKLGDFEKENSKKWGDLNNIEYGSDFYTPIPQDINSYVNYSEIYKDVDSSLGEINNGK